MVNRPYLLLARLCWLSVSVGSLLFGPALLDECSAKSLKSHRTGGSGGVSDVTAPTFQSGTIAADGTTLTLVFDEAVIAATSAGFTLTPSGSAATISLSSGSGTTTLICTINRTIDTAETATIAYASGSGNIQDVAGNALATFSATSVTNNSATSPPIEEYPSGYSAWIADVILTLDHHGDRWVSGVYNSTNAYGAFGVGQYEPWYCFRELNDFYYGGADVELEAQAVAAGDVWRTIIGSVATPYQIPGYFNYTRGYADDYIRNGDTTSQTAVVQQSLLATYAPDSTPLSYAIGSQIGSREAAYSAMSYMQAERCGENHRDRTEAMIRLMLADVGETVSYVREDTGTTNSRGVMAEGGHIEEWLGDYVTDSDGTYVSGTTRFVSTNYAPFMAGLTAYTLIYHYEQATQNGTHQGSGNSATLTVDDGGWQTDFLVGRTVNNVTDGSTGTITANDAAVVTATLTGGTDNDWDVSDVYKIVGTLDGGAIDADEDTIPKLVRLADATWNECWEVVPDSGSFYLRPNESQTAKALNNLAVHYWWFLYLKTGEPRFLLRADQAFNETNGYENLVYRGTSTHPNYSKELNELTRYTFDGLENRRAAVHTHDGVTID